VKDGARLKLIDGRHCRRAGIGTVFEARAVIER
jgi:hypothetical protein